MMRLSAILSAAAAATCVAAGLAAEPPSGEQTADAQDDTIVVTGSRIVREVVVPGVRVSKISTICGAVDQEGAWWGEREFDDEYDRIARVSALRAASKAVKLCRDRDNERTDFVEGVRRTCWKHGRRREATEIATSSDGQRAIVAYDDVVIKKRRRPDVLYILDDPIGPLELHGSFIGLSKEGDDWVVAVQGLAPVTGC